MPYTIPSYTVSPGSVYQPRKSKLILDQITGAIAAWSTRRLISSAPADIARGRDASTNEQDFTAAELAGSGFTDLAGAGDGFYVTLYDQIGSNNATQSIAASQPKGVSSGALITDGSGVPVCEFNGTNNELPFTSAINLASDFCIFLRVKFNATNAQHLFVGTTSLNRIYIETNLKQLVVIVGGGLNINSFTPALSTSTFYTICFSRSSGVLNYYIDGSALPNPDANTGTLSLTRISLVSTIGLNGDISDVIFFDRALTAGEISQLHTALI